MSSPLRDFIQDKFDFKVIRGCTQLAEGKTILEIGCGNGHGAKLIKKYFKPAQIYAIDLDERIIAIAKGRNRDPSITFEVADAARLPCESEAFDAIFDFWALHHIPNWKECLAELKRVLKPHGEVIVIDHSIETFTTTAFGRHLKKMAVHHPYEDMYSKEELFASLHYLGFKVVRKDTHAPLDLYFVAVAEK